MCVNKGKLNYLVYSLNVSVNLLYFTVYHRVRDPLAFSKLY